MNSNDIFRENLILMSRLRGITFTELLKGSGLSESTIVNLRRESINISLALVDKVARHVDVPAEILISAGYTQSLKRIDKELPRYMTIAAVPGVTALKPCTALLNDIQIFKVKEWERMNLQPSERQTK